MRLVLAGFSVDQIRLVEAAGGIGGTWYRDRFPGLHCDVESCVYMPLPKVMGYMPSQKYTSGAEIRRYLQKGVDRYQLDDKIILGTKVDSLRRKEQDRIWKAVFSSSQDPALSRDKPPAGTWGVESEFVILTAGYLSRPLVLNLDGAGVDSFQGAMFLLHTARCDYGVTSGSSEDASPRLEKLKTSESVSSAPVRQRSKWYRAWRSTQTKSLSFNAHPSAVYSRGQQDTDAKEWTDKTASAEGRRRDRMENMTARMSRSAASGSVDLVDDEWTKLEAYAAMGISNTGQDTRPCRLLFGVACKA